MRGETSPDAQPEGASTFQSTPLMRGETLCGAFLCSSVQISIHSPHARGDKFSRLTLYSLSISIHSPHARGDDDCRVWACGCLYFNPLPSCEGRPEDKNTGLRAIAFQSTPLMRGETRISFCHCWNTSRFQSTPLMRGETKSFALTATVRVFQSTPLMRGETIIGSSSQEFSRKRASANISIHSPHARGDHVEWPRTVRDHLGNHRLLFQSTPLMRGETA